MEAREAREERACGWVSKKEEWVVAKSEVGDQAPTPYSLTLCL